MKTGQRLWLVVTSYKDLDGLRFSCSSPIWVQMFICLYFKVCDEAMFVEGFMLLYILIWLYTLIYTLFIYKVVKIIMLLTVTKY